MESIVTIITTFVALVLGVLSFVLNKKVKTTESKIHKRDINDKREESRRKVLATDLNQLVDSLDAKYGDIRDPDDSQKK